MNHVTIDHVAVCMISDA